MKDTAARLLIYINKVLDKKKVENYYYSGGDERKTYSARWLDRLFVRIMVFTAAFIIAVFVTKSSFTAAVLSLVVLGLYYLAERKLNRRNILKGKEQVIRKEMIKRFCDRVKTADEDAFFELIKKLFERSRHFYDLKLIISSTDKPVLMEGLFKEQRIGIYCRKAKEQQKVKAEDLRKFVDLCKGRGLKKGIYVTNGYFNYCAKEYAIGLDDFGLLLADINCIYRGFLRKGLLFPMEEIEKSISSKVLDRSRIKENNTGKILSAGRVKTYMTLGALLLIYSYYVQYKLYYAIVSIILFSLGITATVRWYMAKYKDFLEREVSLDRYIAGA